MLQTPTVGIRTLKLQLPLSNPNGKRKNFCSSYREIRIIESILQGFLKDGDFTYVPIRESSGFGLDRFNCIVIQ